MLFSRRLRVGDSADSVREQRARYDALLGRLRNLCLQAAAAFFGRAGIGRTRSGFDARCDPAGCGENSTCG